jgi:hypothetical protein
MKLEVPMDSEYHYRFLEADAKLLKEIQRENGDCYIRIDRKLCVAEISGHRESIYAAQRKIEAILTDLV